MPTFIAKSRNLRVTFPFDRFGLGDGIEEFIDKQGNKVGKRLPWRPAKFDNFSLREERPNRVEMLRQHRGNRANGGDDFWEQPEADVAGIAALHGRTEAFMPEGGMTKDDIADLEYLTVATRVIAPRAVDNIRKRAEKVHTRFRVIGIAVPPLELNITRLRGRVTEIMGVIADKGIWTPSNAEQKRVDTGRSQAANG